MIGSSDRKSGFSLIEVLVVLVIAAILTTMGYSALRSGRTMSKETTCLNNLKQISVAINLYYNDHGAYPPEDLRGLLSNYTGRNPSLFICPNDPDPQGDSYSEFYVARLNDNVQDYVCACPRHVAEASAITLFSSTSTQLLEMVPVRWNGQQIQPGTSVGSGVVSFGDGSKVLVPEGMVVRLVQSFRMHDGRFYSLIGVPINETGTLDIEVTPGSRFEVVTPAAIAGVQGTRFLLTVTIDGDYQLVEVDVKEGKVEMTNRWQQGKTSEVLVAGEKKEEQVHRGKMAKLLKKWWDKRRKHLDDDWRYDPCLLESSISLFNTTWPTQ